VSSVKQHRNQIEADENAIEDGKDKLIKQEISATGKVCIFAYRTVSYLSDADIKVGRLQGDSKCVPVCMTKLRRKSVQAPECKCTQ